MNVTNLNDNTPVITSGGSATSIAENSGSGQKVYTVTASDMDEGSTLTYALAGIDEDDFNIDANSGVVTLKVNPDYETKASYRFSVTASDGKNTSTSQSVNLNVTNLNDNTPVITSGGSATSIAENSGSGQKVYTVTASDMDEGSTLTYALAGIDEDDFNIDANSGVVTLKVNPDYETKASYRFSVTASDGKNTSTSQSVNLNVTNLNDNTPVITSGGSATSIAENSGSGQKVYTVTASDMDEGSTLTYALAGIDEDDFNIDANSGVVTLKVNPDYETKASYRFSVTASDGKNTSTSQSVNLNVTNLNDNTPVITSGGSATSIAENSGSGQKVYTVTASDMDEGSTLTYALAGIDEDDFNIDANSGVVTLKVNPDYETKASYRFSVTASDGKNTSNAKTITLAITDVDDIIDTDDKAPIVTVNVLGTSVRRPALSGTIDDPTATLEVIVSGISYTPEIEGNTWSLAQGLLQSDLAEGFHDIVVTATDEAGNVGRDATTNEILITTDIQALQGSFITSIGFQANWSEGVDVASYRLDVSTDPSFTSFLTGYENREVSATSEMVTGLDFSSNYYYRVRMINIANDVTENSNVVGVKTTVLPETVADSVALTQIYADLGGDLWSVSVNWKTTRLREWTGITLDNQRSRVQGINLSGFLGFGKMRDTFTDDAIGGLSEVTEINLSNNLISKLMDFRQMTKLNTLDVSGNRLDFEDVEVLVSLPNPIYGNQRPILFNQSTRESENMISAIKIPYTENYFLSVTTPGTDNSYTWYRNEKRLTTTSNSNLVLNGNELNILDINYDNMGDFKVEVTSSIATGLTLQVETQAVLATANIKVEAKNQSEELLQEKIDAFALEVTASGRYDTLNVLKNSPSNFTLERVVLGDYLLAIESDPSKYIGTYSGNSFLWEKAVVVSIRKDTVYAVKMNEKPQELTEEDGQGICSGVIYEEFDDSSPEGRVEARRRAARRKCGLRKKRTGGRTVQDEDEFELIAYGETNDRGEFNYGFLPQGTYRFFIEFPGIPLDKDSFTEFTVGESGIDEDQFRLEATIAENGIVVELVEELGVVLEYFKNLKIYPNPASTHLKIKYRHLRVREVTAQLVNMSGRVIWEQELKEGYDGDLTIDVSNYHDGIYFLRCFDKKRASKTVLTYKVYIKK